MKVERRRAAKEAMLESMSMNSSQSNHSRGAKPKTPIDDTQWNVGPKITGPKIIASR